MITRRVRIYNHYLDDGQTIELEETVEILTPEEVAATGETALSFDGSVVPRPYDDYLGEVLWRLTGTDRPGDAYYNVSSVDGLEPEINEDWWG